MTETTLYKLVNPKFSFEFNGKQYEVRKANLEKAVQYQSKVAELSSSADISSHLRLVAYCIYLVLKDVEPSITEQEVLDNTPGDIDPVECLTNLGFINQRKAETAKNIEDALLRKATSDNSLSS